MTETPEDAPPPPPAGPGGLLTDEQQSGRAADAVKKLQAELKNRYTELNSAEEGLSEVLLSAHAATAAGQQKLNDIQKQIIEAANSPSAALDTPAGEVQYLTFLRNQMRRMSEVFTSGTLTDDDLAKTVNALGRLYAADVAAGPRQRPPAPGDPAAVPVRPPDRVTGDSGPDDLRPEDLGLDNRGLGNLGLGNLGAPLGPDPLSGSALPAAPGGGSPPMGGGLGSPLDALAGMPAAAAPLAGMPAAAAPLAGLGSGLANRSPASGWYPRRDEPVGAKDDSEAEKDDTHGTDGTEDADTKPELDQQQQPGTPRAPSATTVVLPDGSVVDARTPGLASAVRAHLAGAPVAAAYRQAGIELPPPGTPVTAPVDPSQLGGGDIGMFRDHYVVALGAGKALKDGQVTPVASVASGPDFLGWFDPSTLAAPARAAVAPPPAPTRVPPPVPATSG